MAAVAQRIADLDRQVAELAAEVSSLRQQAFIARTLEDMALARAGYSTSRARGDTGRRSPARRPRHLAVAGGGTS
jgi:hypothetical protein